MNSNLHSSGRMSSHARRRRVMLAISSACHPVAATSEPLDAADSESASPFPVSAGSFLHQAPPDLVSPSLPVSFSPRQNSAQTSRPLKNQVDVRHLEQAGEGSSHVHQIQRWLSEQSARVWMFAGDETTAWMRYHGQPGYAEMFRHRLRWELKRTSDLIINAGLLGAGIEETQKISLQGLKQRQVDVLFVMPGKNDLTEVVQQPHLYADKLTRFIRLIREHGAEPVLQTPPLPHGSIKNRQLAPLAQQADLIREVALTEQAALIDHAEFWMEQASSPSWYKTEAGHLSQKGQLALAFLFFSELDLFDRHSTLCKRMQLAWPEIQPTSENPTHSAESQRTILSARQKRASMTEFRQEGGTD